jgi:hypothetical protein
MLIMRLFLSFFSLILLVLLIQNERATPAGYYAGFQNFITAKSDREYDGGKEYRFISFNIQNLLTIEDNVPFNQTNYWRLPNQFEIGDALESVNQLGGQVVRTYVITVKLDSDTPRTVKYAEAPGSIIPYDIHVFSETKRSNLKIWLSKNGNTYHPATFIDRDLYIGKMEYNYVPPVLVYGSVFSDT